MIIVKNGDKYFNLEYFQSAVIEDTGMVNIKFADGQETFLAVDQWELLLAATDSIFVFDVNDKSETSGGSFETGGRID